MTLPRFAREIAPQSHTRWLVQHEDEGELLQAMFADWLKEVANDQKLFKEYVYENKNLTDLDLRQHRARLCGLISRGEFLAFAFIEWAAKTQALEQVKSHIGIVDQKLKELFEALFAWHGDLQSQPDIPESFKRAAQEAERGNIVDFKEP